MVKLSDYLGYLYSEISQARKMADEHAVQTAKEYAKNDYLKFFRAPRFTMPSVKLDIPVKISGLDTEVKHKFNVNKKAYLKIVNNKIQKANQSKNLKIQPLTKEQLETDEFNSIIKELKNYDNRYVEKIDHVINGIDFKPVVNGPVLKAQSSTADNIYESEVLSQIMRESSESLYTPVSIRLNKVFIDPNTSRESDKEKTLIILHVDMVEEGIEINYVEDEKGNKIEKVIID